ncbi:MAG: helix-turn-helix domain-containing protein, partial [Clostridiales bacterium]|nr:helix-turn-helix domain-containing protein [Clostridiales bacterium]
MENYGKTIAELRKEKNLTQSELGQALNVTAQAVSKWENDQAQPPVDTFFEICTFFGISADEFRRRAAGEPIEPAAPADEATATEPEADIKEETAQSDSTELALQPAAELVVQPDTEIEPVLPEEPVRHVRQLSVGFLIVMILAIAAGLATFISLMIVLEINEFLPALFPFFLGYFVFSFVILIGHESVVWDFFVGALFNSVNLPLIIFDLSPDGIFLMILYKFIIAPIITAIIWLALVIGAFFLSIFMAGFVFPFRIPTISRETFGG